MLLLKIFSRTLLVFTETVALYVLVAIISLLAAERPLTEQGDNLIYIRSNGVHCDVLIPVQQAGGQRIAELLGRPDWLDQSEWMSIGWGDEGFYVQTPTWGDLTFTTAFKAIFTRSPSVVRVEAADAPMQGPNVRQLQITDAQMLGLTQRITQAFSSVEGQLLTVDSEYGHFYRGNNSYHAFRTCNQWLADLLNASGIPCSKWAPFDWSILYAFD